MPALKPAIPATTNARVNRIKRLAGLDELLEVERFFFGADFLARVILLCKAAGRRISIAGTARYCR